MNKELPFAIIIIGVIFFVQAFLFLFLINAFPEQKFTLYITIISAIPSIALILVTLLYVITSHKILKENQLFRKRTFIEGMIKKMLFPLLDAIKIVTKGFQTKSWYSVKNQKFDLKGKQLKNLCFDKHADVFYKTFEKNYHKLSCLLILFDNKIPEIEELINQLMQKISSKEFCNKWIEKINSFEKTISGREEGFPSFGRNQQSGLIDCILDSILQGKNLYLPNLFWTKHSEEILSERKHYKKEFEHMENKTNEIICSLAELKDVVERTIISEQEKYGFLAYD